MGFPEILHISIILFYALGTTLFFVGMTTKNDKLKRLSSWFAVFGFSLQSFEISSLLLKDTTPFYTGKFYFSILAWCVLVAYFYLWRRLKLEFLAITSLPLATMLYIASLSVEGIVVKMPPELTTLFFGLHIGVLAMTLGSLVMAFGAGLAFLYYNRQLKTKAGLTGIGKDVPSLDKFDRVNSLVVILGFPLYTLGIFSTVIWYCLEPTKSFTWDITKIGSLAVWFLFAFLFHQRLVFQWRGRKPALIMLWVFAGMCISLIHHTITFRAMP